MKVNGVLCCFGQNGKKKTFIDCMDKRYFQNVLICILQKKESQVLSEGE